MASCEGFSDNPEVIEASRALQQRCVERLEVLMKFPKKFCENCQSVTCQNGLVIDDEVRKGARVRSSDKGKRKVTGEVVGVGFGKRAKLECGENGNHFQTDAFCVRMSDGTVEYCNSSSGWMYDCM